MKIIEMVIENNKTVRCFNLRLDGKNLTVAGDTGTGKTTATSLFWEIMNGCTDAITHGENKSILKIKLSDGSKTITAKRIITKKTSTISVTDSEGDTISMADFKKLISKLAVNPHQIINMKPTEQLATLAASADMGDVDLAAMDVEIANAEDDRLDLSRRMDTLKPGDEPRNVESVDIVDLSNQKDEAERNNSERALLEQRLENINQNGLNNKDTIARLKEELLRLESTQTNLRTEVTEVEASLKKMEVINTSVLLTAIAEAQVTNEQAGEHSRWVEDSKVYEEASGLHKEAAQKVKDLRGTKKTALDSAKWPIPDLTIEGGQILYKECLLSNLGTSEQLLVCAAIALKDIEAHPIKVVRMDGIEAMSKEDFATLTKMFNGRGVQVLATRVAWGDTEPGEIEIVDGVYDEGGKDSV